MEASEAMLTVESLAGAPYQTSYWLTTDCEIQTTVTGDARNVATVAIKYGTLIMWSTTLTQTDPTHATSDDLIIGSTTLKAGLSFTLTIPTSQQSGNILAQGSLSHAGQKPLQFSLYVATWQLASSGSPS
jgi:hypothetical protein